MFSSLIKKLFNASFSPSWDLCRPDIAVSFLNSLALVPHPLWSLNFPSLYAWGEVRLTHEVIWRWMNLPPFVGFHFFHCGGMIWSFIILSSMSLSSTSISISPPTRCVSVCLFLPRSLFVSFWFVFFVFVLQGQGQNRLKACCSSGKEQKNRPSVRRIDSLVIHRYSLQQF